MTRCFVGLGANLGDSHQALIEAAQGLEQLADNQHIERSAIYRSAPMGPRDQPDYLNAVIAMTTSLEPLNLLDALQSLETNAGRVRDRHWGPRTLDLDLLIYGNVALDSQRLTLPHRGVFERNFVLRPLADIVGEAWTFEDGSTLAQRLSDCPDNELQKTELGWSLAQPEAISA